MTGRGSGRPGASVCPGADTTVFARLAAALTSRWGAAGYGALSLSSPQTLPGGGVVVVGRGTPRAAFLFFLLQLKGRGQSPAPRGG